MIGDIMKVYVLNIKADSERLAAFEEAYPDCLPEYTVWEAKTGADVDVPEWWCSSANRWSLVQNFIDILSQDDGEEDILIFEDDCTFCDDFETKYNAFLEEVPEDWDMLYLGAQHITAPVQVSDNVLKLVNSVCGHAVIYNHAIKQALIEWYSKPNWGCQHMPDMRRAQGMSSGRFIGYSPLVNMCGQSEGYSHLTKSNRKSRWYNSFRYITKDGLVSELKYGEQVYNTDIIVPIESLKGKEVCSVAVYGSNIFYAITFLLKVQELQQKLGLPIVCHVDETNYEWISKMASQENIDISEVVFITHEDAPITQAQFWRYMPVGASVLHVFDVDNKLHQAHIDAINDFRDNEKTIGVYTCKYVRSFQPILGGAVGFREDILIPTFNYVNKLIGYPWGADEHLTSKYLLENGVSCLVYTTKGCKNVNPGNWRVKPSDYHCNRLHYKDSDFNKLAYYSNGMYHIEDKEYLVSKGRKY